MIHPRFSPSLFIFYIFVSLPLFFVVVSVFVTLFRVFVVSCLCPVFGVRQAQSCVAIGIGTAPQCTIESKDDRIHDRNIHTHMLRTNTYDIAKRVGAVAARAPSTRQLAIARTPLILTHSNTYQRTHPTHTREYHHHRIALNNAPTSTASPAEGANPPAAAAASDSTAATVAAAPKVPLSQRIKKWIEKNQLKWINCKETKTVHIQYRECEMMNNCHLLLCAAADSALSLTLSLFVQSLLPAVSPSVSTVSILSVSI